MTIKNGIKKIINRILYNAYTTKETIYNPADILNLSQYNSDGSSELYDSNGVDDFIPATVKRVSLNDFDNIEMLNRDE